MHAFVPTRPPFLASVEEAPTLPTVLTTMGHNCDGSCPTEAEQLKAIWYVPRGPQVGSVGLVLVDVSDPDASIAELARIIADVNRCTQRDRIRVRPRRH
jgi:hypothetical protein